MELFGSILGTTAVQAMRIWAAMGYSVAKLQFILSDCMVTTHGFLITPPRWVGTTPGLAMRTSKCTVLNGLGPKWLLV